MFFVAMILLQACNSCDQGLILCTDEDLTSFVNPMIGTGGFVQAFPGDSVSYDSIRNDKAVFPFGGLVYPGAVVPFGMIQLSPDCNTNGFGWSAGYHYSDSTLLGFSHMHTSGNGMGFGHFLFLPFAEDNLSPNHSPVFKASFSHSKEKSSPGYYSVNLPDDDILVELTVTERVGMHRYWFPDNKEACVLIDLVHGLGEWGNPLQARMQMVNDSMISGFRLTQNGIKTYFTAIFSQRIRKIRNVESQMNTGKPVIRDSSARCVLSFGPLSEPLLIKVSISFTEPGKALNNILCEVPGWDFDQIRLRAHGLWNAELQKIRIEKGNRIDLERFYTALYHASLTPFLFCDADSSFLGADGKSHESPGFPNYTFFTLWDTYRALHPLFTIIRQNRAEEMLKSMVLHATLSPDSLLPLWCLASKNYFNMAGYSSAPVLAEAWAKGIRGFDANRAYNLLVKNTSDKGFGGHEEFLRIGYVPADSEKLNVPKTLEYAFCDWNIGKLGMMLGRSGADSFIRTSANYRNQFDTVSGFMRPRLSNGSWKKPFDPGAVSHQFSGSDYMESNAWQYTWHVMHDVNGLIQIMGGREKFIAKLDSLFDQPSELTGIYAADVSGLIGQYAQGNQPSHHVAYLYAYAGQPWKTQYRIHQIMENTYSDTPEGLPGNDDGGEMSAWFVFSALGFYPVNPASGIYVIGSPLFEKSTIQVEPGNPSKVFTIKALHVSGKNIYIQSARLNGAEYSRPWISHAEIMKGGTLEFTMGPNPSQEWGTGGVPELLNF